MGGENGVREAWGKPLDLRDRSPPWRRRSTRRGRGSTPMRCVAPSGARDRIEERRLRQEHEGAIGRPPVPHCRSPAAISSNVPPTCTVAVRDTYGSRQGIGSLSGVVDLEAMPGRTATGRSDARAGLLSRSPAMAANWSGVTSRRSASDGGSSRERRHPLSGADLAAERCESSRPWRPSSRAEPPLAMGQPLRCPASASARPTPLVAGWVSGSTECAARPAMSARACVRVEPAAKRCADGSAASPNRAMANGLRGMRSSGERLPAITASTCVGEGSEAASVRVARRRRADAAVSSTEPPQHDRRPVVERMSDGHRRRDPLQPVSVERQVAKKRRRGPNGWAAAHTSWWKPGSVSSVVRVPPPIRSWPSITSTRDVVARQFDGCGQSVGSRADDHGVVLLRHHAADSRRPTAARPGG